MMDKEKLLGLVSTEYHRLNIRDGRYRLDDIVYKAPEQLMIGSNQIRALINVIAPLLPEKEENEG